MGLDIKRAIANELSEYVGIDSQTLYSLLEVPPDLRLGDFAVPCFVFAKHRRQNPGKISLEFENKAAQKSGQKKIINRTKAEGPYLNIFLDRKLSTARIISYISQTDFRSLRSQGKGRTVVIDFSSPNIAKPFGVGHLRSTVIGNSLKKIFSFLGYKTIGINHLGDWGTQFGKLITAYKKWGEEEQLAHNPVEYLYRLYVTYHSRAEDDPRLDHEARGWFSRLEQGDPEALELWEKFRELSIQEFKRIYQRLGVSFEYYTGESFYGSMLQDTLDQVKETGITRISEGALIVPLEDLPVAMLAKKDGSTLYLTRDLAAALYRYEKFGFDKCLYVVGDPQSLHFQQLFKVLEKMGRRWVENCYHVPFGQIRFEDDSMSTRKGNIIFLEEVLDRASRLAMSIVEEKNPGLPNKQEIAEAVGVGSIIFNDLKNYRIKDITFRWDEVLNFNGETGVYLQYTYARISSLVKKFTQVHGEVEWKSSPGFGEEGYRIALHLNDFEDTVLRAAREFEPSNISRYLLELASQFNSFYNTYRVVTEDRRVAVSRVLIVLGVKKVLRQGLELLGIRPIEEM
ncbi:MAG: arginine--tRNA ligase [Spirochaetota bacterium]